MLTSGPLPIEADVAEDLPHPKEWYEKRLVRRLCAMSLKTNELMGRRNQEGQKVFLTGFAGDLIHDGYALHCHLYTEKLAWVVYYCGTHFIYDRKGALSVMGSYGDNRAGEYPVQWMKLVEVEPDPMRWGGTAEIGTAEWVECEAEEALAMWPEDAP